MSGAKKKNGKKRTPKKAIAYLRVSSKEQAEGLSLDAQRNEIQAWADREGVLVVEWFADEGESAYREPQKRPAFQAMIDRAEEGITDVLVHKGDRFSRDLETAIVVKAYLRRKGVTVRATAEPFDLDTPAGRLTDNMMAILAAFYAENLGQEVKKGKAEALRQGWRPGSRPPYGYRIERVPGGRSILVPGPVEEVEAVQAAFKMAAEGASPTPIAAHLRHIGAPTPRSGRWSRSAVRYLLRNASYCGDLVWGKKTDRTTYHNTHEAIIDRTTWNKTQRHMSERSQIKTGRPATNGLLAGIIFGACGHRYYRRPGIGGKHGYYLCAENARGGSGSCSAPYAQIARTDRIVLDRVLLAIQPEHLAEVREKAIRAAETRAAEAAESEAARRLAEIDEQRANIAAAIARGAAVDTLGTLDDELQRERVRVEVELSRVANAASAEEVKAALRDLETLADELRKRWYDAPFELQKQGVHSFVREVVIHEDGRVEVKLHHLEAD